ncbi:MAG: ATP synthase F1 subunit epsilon [Oscillospiraceae bacterium]|nr:ATP synthase F1 subunit epsilon [Oscillospiraceae bacterium]
MANTFTLSIFAPDKRFLEIEATEVVFSTPEGRMGVMAGHMPMVASAVEGIVEIKQEGVREGEQGERKTAAISQGFVDIGGDKVSFFVGTAEWAEEIDEARAKAAIQRAQAKLDGELNRAEYVRAKTAIARAMARLKAVDAGKRV